MSVDMIKEELQTIFMKCGNVLDVHAIKHYRTRGQAWVVFDSIASATRAIETLNGHVFHGRPFQCNFARSKSDLVAREDGTYVEKRKKRKRDDVGGSEDSDAAAGSERKVFKAPPKHVEKVAPHQILFAYELPDDCTKIILEGLFSSYSGFKEIRHLATRNVAFIEFIDIPSASYALSMLKSHRLTPKHTLRLNFAKQ
jgi:U2 small nuclear ribonucleoprotein B''|tara:strand:- start:65 stop:658 length:594 start_codon:yes stop_codon:yes gene_type:complete